MALPQPPPVVYKMTQAHTKEKNPTNVTIEPSQFDFALLFSGLLNPT